MTVSPRRELSKVRNPGRALPKKPKRSVRMPALTPKKPVAALCRPLLGSQLNAPSMAMWRPKLTSPSTAGPRAAMPGPPTECAIHGDVASEVDVPFHGGPKSSDAGQAQGAEGGAGFKASGGILRGGNSGKKQYSDRDGSC